MYVFLYSSSLTLTARVTAFLNGIETILNLVYLYLAHVVGWPAANLIGFAAATMTLSKTMLYWAQEYYCGYCAVGHNSLPDLLLYFVLPNAFVNSVLFWFILLIFETMQYVDYCSFLRRHQAWEGYS